MRRTKRTILALALAGGCGIAAAALAATDQSSSADGITSQREMVFIEKRARAEARDGDWLFLENEPVRNVWSTPKQDYDRMLRAFNECYGSEMAPRTLIVWDEQRLHYPPGEWRICGK